MLKIFETLPGLYLVLTPDLTIRAVSDAYLKETLAEREKIVGEYVFDIFPDNPNAPEAKGVANLYASFKEVLSTRKPHTMAVQHYDVPDPKEEGRFVERYWSPTNVPVLNEQGEVMYIIHEVVSVTEKIKASQALKESQSREQNALEKAEHQRARLERFLMQAPAIIVVHDGPEFIFEFVNPLYQQVLPGRDLLGKPLFEALPELLGTPIERIVRQVYETGETYEGKEVSIPLADYEGGPLRNNYYNFIYQARKDEQGKVDGIMVFAYDVSEQVKARKVIEESAWRFLFMANAMPQKVWTAATAGKLDYLNEQWKEYTGLSLQELSATGWEKVIHPDDLEEVRRVWKKAFKSGLDFQLEHRLRRKDGVYRWHLTRGVAHREEDGAIRMWIGTNTDIHDQKVSEQSLQELAVGLKAANQQLTHINVDLDNFIYTASHDLKAPIINIEGLLNLLKQKIAEEKVEREQLKPLMEMMQASVDRFKRVVTNLTDITKLQKEANQRPSQVSIPETIREVMLDLEQMIKESDVHVELDVEDCPFIISFSEKNLRSIVYNLLSNAIKYRSPERAPQIHISCQTIPDFVVLKVRDNGLGIDPRHEKKLFSMFRRLHTHVDGSGIGLFMIKRIIENSGGKIQVESSLGKGSTFSVYFKK